MRVLKKIKYKLLSIITKPVTPPPYEVKRAIIDDYRKSYSLDHLVETGTFLGDTVEHFKSSFKKITSIELAEDLAAKAKKRFINDAHVGIIQGDSSIILQTLVQEINHPALFWLDGHYSSEFFMGDEYIKTARGKKDSPVEEELNIILSSGVNHIILIDDAREFTGLSDYPSISAVKKQVKKARGNNYAVKVENDIIRIFPNQRM